MAFKIRSLIDFLFSDLFTNWILFPLIDVLFSDLFTTYILHPSPSLSRKTSNKIFMFLCISLPKFTCLY